VAENAASVGGPRTGTGGVDQRSIDELLKYIEGDSSKGGSKKRTQTNPKRRGGQKS